MELAFFAATSVPAARRFRGAHFVGRGKKTMITATPHGARRHTSRPT